MGEPFGNRAVQQLAAVAADDHSDMAEIEGESLASVLGERPVEQLTRHAQGKPGECKGCHHKLQAGEQAGILESLLDPIFVINADGKVVAWNEAFLRLSGWDPVRHATLTRDQLLSERSPAMRALLQPLKLNAEAVAAGAQTDLDKLGIAKNAREEQLKARKAQKELTPEEKRHHAEMEKLYRQHVLKEEQQPLLQIGGLGKKNGNQPTVN